MNDEIQKETERLYQNLKHAAFTREQCATYAELTLQINTLKKQKDMVILAHSYQTPDIMFGIADFKGDSYGLSVEATKVKQKTIVFCGVRFMAETAKILNPDKTILLPAPDAGCSLAESITPEEVRKLKKQHPKAKVVCYINTNADIKAVSDVCVTSGNALKIIETVDSNEIIFIPDRYMGENLQKLTKKKLHLWHGKCIVHQEFTVKGIDAVRKKMPQVKVFSHYECPPEVIAASDSYGGTGDMIRYIKSTQHNQFLLVTECGMSDRMRIEFPDRQFVGTCRLCPYMKRINLLNVLAAMRNPEGFEITLEKTLMHQAKKCIEKMFELANK